MARLEAGANLEGLSFLLGPCHVGKHVNGQLGVGAQNAAAIPLDENRVHQSDLLRLQVDKQDWSMWRSASSYSMWPLKSEEGNRGSSKSSCA